MDFKLPPDRETMYAFALASLCLASECLKEVADRDDAFFDDLEARIANEIKSAFAENMSYETENSIVEKAIVFFNGIFKDMVRDARR